MQTVPRLIILRGNSGSGKSTIARAVRLGYGYGCALVEQDYLRRVLLRERDVPGGDAVRLIDLTVRFALAAGYHVICEGILHSDRYGAMLRALVRDHSSQTSTFYLDVSFPETLRRHAQRPQSGEFSGADMRAWYVERDVLGVPGERVVDESAAFEDTVRLVAGCLPRKDPDPERS